MYIVTPCSFNFYADYIMRNTGLNEAQARIKIAGRNINNLRYADDTTIKAESEEELNGFLVKMKEQSEKVGFPNSTYRNLRSSAPMLVWDQHLVPSFHGK